MASSKLDLSLTDIIAVSIFGQFALRSGNNPGDPIFCVKNAIVLLTCYIITNRSLALIHQRLQAQKAAAKLASAQQAKTGVSDAKKPAKKADKKATKKDAPKTGPKQAQQPQKNKEGGAAAVPNKDADKKKKKNKKAKGGDAIAKAVATGDSAKAAVANKQQKKKGDQPKKGDQQKQTKKGGEQQQKQKPATAAPSVSDFKSLQITVSNNVPAAVRFGGGMGGAGPMRGGMMRGPMRGGMQGGQARKQLMNQKRGLGGSAQGGVRKIVRK